MGKPRKTKKKKLTLKWKKTYTLISIFAVIISAVLGLYIYVQNSPELSVNIKIDASLSFNADSSVFLTPASFGNTSFQRFISYPNTYNSIGNPARRIESSDETYLFQKLPKYMDFSVNTLICTDKNSFCLLLQKDYRTNKNNSHTIYFSSMAHAKRVLRTEIGSIHHETGKETITDGKELLHTTAQWLYANPECELLISSHADTDSPQWFNDKLSMKRSLFVSHSILKETSRDLRQSWRQRMHPQAFGKRYPILDSNESEIKASSRRTELALLCPQGNPPKHFLELSTANRVRTKMHTTLNSIGFSLLIQNDFLRDQNSIIGTIIQ